MEVVVGSAFRNFGHAVGRYMLQVKGLQKALGPEHKVRVLAVEGDSVDTTRAQLESVAAGLGIDLNLVTCNHGGRRFGSTECEDRLVALSKVGNAIFENVRESDDVLLYVECDLLWQAADVAPLLKMAAFNEGGFDVFAPMIWAGQLFYDVWGFRGTDDQRFGPFAPYHSSLKPNALCEVNSVGSCLVMRGQVARECRIHDNYCLVGWCRDARSKGYRIAAHTGFDVRHP